MNWSRRPFPDPLAVAPPCDGTSHTPGLGGMRLSVEARHMRQDTATWSALPAMPLAASSSRSDEISVLDSAYRSMASYTASQ